MGCAPARYSPERVAPRARRYPPRATLALRTLALGVLALAGCGDPAPPASAPRFALTEVGREAGLALAPDEAAPPSRQLLDVKGGGVALIDYDCDGDLDVLVPGVATLESPDRGPGARLFENLGELRFRDATADAELDLRSWGFGCAVGDVDGDGRDDVFVACFGRDALLRSRPDGTLEDVTLAAGIDGDAWSTAASFGDLDGDGDLDLYVAGYVAFDPAAPPPPMDFRGARVFGGPMGLAGVPDRVWENLGDGRFRDATAAWGFDAVPASYGLGVVIVDLDGDAAPEVLVGNDSQANFLFVRGADGRFVEVGVQSGVALDEHGWGQATMGIAIGDVNDDGLPDVFSSNFMSDHDTLHVNLGELVFEDRSRRAGFSMVTTPYLGFGCGFVDLDHEGREELVVFHGHVYPETITEPMGWRRDQEPQLFERSAAGWKVVAPEDGGPWLSAAHRDRGVAFGDLDGDGDVDLVVRELRGALRLLRNDAAAGDWLRVALHDARPGVGNRRGLGARVAARWRGETRFRWLASGTSYLSASAPEAHFGLGDDPGPVQLEVRWPDGQVQTVEDVRACQRVEVVRR